MTRRSGLHALVWVAFIALPILLLLVLLPLLRASFRTGIVSLHAHVVQLQELQALQAFNESRARVALAALLVPSATHVARLESARLEFTQALGRVEAHLDTPTGRENLTRVRAAFVSQRTLVDDALRTAIRDATPLLIETPTIVAFEAAQVDLRAAITRLVTHELAMVTSAEAEAEAAFSRSGGLLTVLVVATIGLMLLVVAMALRTTAIARQSSNFEQRLNAIMTHDMRNPLAAIIMTSQSAAIWSGVSQDQARAVARITRCAERIGRLSEILLDYTRARLGRGIPIEPAPAKIEAICAAAGDEMRAAVPGCEIHIAHQGDGAGEWDAGRLMQVLMNLLQNAVRHVGVGSPVELITIGAARSMTIRVHNGGAPIPAGQMRTIFKPFRAKTAVVGSGLGLGLYIAHQLVAAHGGAIRIVSDAASGTTVTVTLPRQAPRPSRAAGAGLLRPGARG